MDSVYQTSSMTSCCSIANLTMLSGAATGTDGKRAWALLAREPATGDHILNGVARWGSWDDALKDAGCSAGGEGQDPQSATPGRLNWFNLSVCGPRA